MAVEGCHAALFHAAQGSRLVAVVGPTVVQVISQASASANPEVVLAMIEDYRAGLTVDRQHEKADRAAADRLRLPLLVLWTISRISMAIRS